MIGRAGLAWMLVALPLLSGCDMAGTAKDMGDYMPTIGDRCESTECITPSGKAASDAIKTERLRRQKEAERGIAPARPALPAKPASNDPYDSTEPF